MGKNNKLKITPEENAKNLEHEVQKKVRSVYKERFTEFIEDLDNRIEKGNEAIVQNEFAKKIVFNSKQSKDPLAQGVIDSFQLAIDMTENTIKGSKAKRQAAIQLLKLVDKNEKVLILDALPLFDMLHGIKQQ
jgi:hypothetical protein